MSEQVLCKIPLPLPADDFVLTARALSEAFTKLGRRTYKAHKPCHAMIAVANATGRTHPVSVYYSDPPTEVRICQAEIQSAIDAATAEKDQEIERLKADSVYEYERWRQLELERQAIETKNGCPPGCLHCEWEAMKK